MIKKFKEYIKESENEKDIRNVISLEELEDQFLRIKEVFDILPSIVFCRIYTKFPYVVNSQMCEVTYLGKSDVFLYKSPQYGTDTFSIDRKAVSIKNFLKNSETAYWIEIPLSIHSDESKILKEINTIKYRLESMFPVEIYTYTQIQGTKHIHGRSSPNAYNFFIKLKN